MSRVTLKPRFSTRIAFVSLRDRRIAGVRGEGSNYPNWRTNRGAFYPRICCRLSCQRSLPRAGNISARGGDWIKPPAVVAPHEGPFSDYRPFFRADDGSNLPPLKILPVELPVPSWSVGMMTLKDRTISPVASSSWTAHAKPWHPRHNKKNGAASAHGAMIRWCAGLGPWIFGRLGFKTQNCRIARRMIFSLPPRSGYSMSASDPSIELVNITAGTINPGCVSAAIAMTWSMNRRSKASGCSRALAGCLHNSPYASRRAPARQPNRRSMSASLP